MCFLPQNTNQLTYPYRILENNQARQVKLNQKLCSAVERNEDLDNIVALINQGAEVDAFCRNYPYVTPLYIAAEKGNVRVVLLLLNKDSNVNGQMNSYSPLHVSVRKGYTGVVGILLEKGANVNANYHGLLPLHSAVMENHADVVDLLINYGADINSISPGLGTPLHIAVRTNNKNLVKLLLKWGANINIPYNGKTPVDLAVEEGFEDILTIFFKYGWYPLK